MVLFRNGLTACIRPKLEYSVLFWSPCLKEHIDLMEKVQRKAAKILRKERELTLLQGETSGHGVTHDGRQEAEWSYSNNMQVLEWI